MSLNNALSHFSTLQRHCKEAVCLFNSVYRHTVRRTHHPAPTNSEVLDHINPTTDFLLSPFRNPFLPPPSRSMCHPSSASALPHHDPSSLVAVVPQPILIHVVVLAGWSLRNLPSPLLFTSIVVAETRPISPARLRLRLRPRPSPLVPSSQSWPLYCSINGRGRRAVGGIAT